MWTHPQWGGRHVSAEATKRSALAAYASMCTAVEGNTTFYATPKVETVERWADDAPDGFHFCFKLPREITHVRRLVEADEPIADFLERLAPLGKHLGPVQIQLPASWAPDELPRLAALLPRLSLSESLRWAVEVRHPDFFAGGPHERPLNDLLAQHGVDRITLDSRALFAGPASTPEEVDAWQKKPRLPVRPVATSQTPIVRLIGQNATEANWPFWERWVERVAGWISEGRTPYVFTHTPDNADAPLLARELHARVAKHLGDLAPLPVPPPPITQVGLFDDGDESRSD